MSKQLQSSCCFYCGVEFGLLARYYIIRVQKRKFEKQSKIGKCCENCEARGQKTDYQLWVGDKVPGTVV